MKLVAALPALVALAVLAGSGSAGSYVPPPGDCCLQWSPHGTQIVFAGNRGNGLAVGAVAIGAGPEHFVPGIPVGVRSPDWTYVAYHTNGGLAVSSVDGTGERVLANTNGDFAWAHDSKRLAFVGADGSLHSIAVDGSGLLTLAARPAGSPTWSPDDHLLAYVRTTHRPTCTSSGPPAAVTPRSRPAPTRT